jgi:hypothetical protein
MSSGGDDVFQCIRNARSCVEGAMKGDLYWMSELHESSSPFDVHGAIRPQHTEDDTGCAKEPAVEDIFVHQRNLWLGIEEAAATGSNEDMHGKTTELDSSTDEAMAGSKASFAKSGAELNTVGSSFFRRKTGIDCFGTEFEYHLAIVGLIRLLGALQSAMSG